MCHRRTSSQCLDELPSSGLSALEESAVHSLWHQCACHRPLFRRVFRQHKNEAEVTAWTHDHNDPDHGLTQLFNELFVGGVLTNSPNGGGLQ